MGPLESILAKLQGRNPEQEDTVKKKAQQGITNYEGETGDKFEEEPGIEPDYTAENAASLAMNPGTTMMRTVGNAVVGKVRDSLKEREAAPAFHEAVSAGKAETGAPSFAEFIRPGDSKKPSVLDKLESPMAKESLQTPRMNRGIDPKVSALQSERQSLNLSTEQGRNRLKEIDDLLKNRTYFSEK